MATSKRKSGGKLSARDSRIARAIFAAGESMGISDRKVLEALTSRAIERLEPPAPVSLPGMEHLVAPKATVPTMSQIESVLREILGEEDKTYMTNQTVSLRGRGPSGIELSENALTVLEKRYLIKDSQGKVIETPEEMFWRVARHIASAEDLYSQGAAAIWEPRFFEMMAALEFLPNSPTLMNAGRELGQLSACFVLPIEDSMESIFDAVKYTALIHKSGGGTGFSFSRLRPQHDRVGSTGGVASGPISFMRAFDTATDVIKQGGMRRGANMAILSVDHPDILRFITAKQDSKELTNFNLSVAVTDEFMKALDEGGEYSLRNPRTGEAEGELNARMVFDKIVEMAWRTGDPGIVFIDEINRYNPTPKLGRIESTNPCGEQPLLPFESCNLGSINLSRMVVDRNGKKDVDYEKLGRTVKLAVRFLDDVIDVNKFPLVQIEKISRTTRKIGLGVMGFADMLIELGIGYNSDKAIELAESIMRFVSEESTKESAELAGERGVFPAFEGSVYDRQGGRKLRNACRTTIAPTGTLSIIAGCSSGIEPLFALSYKRHVLDGNELVEVNPYFEEAAKKGGFYSLDLMKQLADGVSLQEMANVPDWVKKVFVTAHDISPEWHIRIQSAFQKHTDNAVSKTVNFPHEATQADVAKVYMMAFKERLKGITIYRDRSRDSQVLTLGESAQKATDNLPAPELKLVPRERPKVTKGVTERITTGCGHIYVTVNLDDYGICEVFASLGKAGGCASAQLEATTRLISLALRSGIDVASIVKHLRGIRCPSISWENGQAVLSCADAIGNVLQKHVNGGEPAVENHGASHGTSDQNVARAWVGQCPECGGGLVYQEGCHICPGCGYTKC